MAEGDLGGILGNVLQNPAMLSGVLSLFGNASDEDTEVGEKSESEKRKALLLAIVPYLGEARGQKVKQLLQILQVIDNLQAGSALLSELKEVGGDEAP